MKIGKIPETVLIRSVLKKIKTKREEVLVGADLGEDCAVLKLEENEAFVLSTDPITGTVQDIGNLAVHAAVNDVVSSGAQAIGIMANILMPENARESELKEIMDQMESVCGKLDIQIIGGHTEVTKAVNQPLITVTGVGKVKADTYLRTGLAKPGQDVIVTKWVGLEGTSILAKEKSHELRERFPEQLIERSKNFDQYISVAEEARIAAAGGAVSMHDAAEGGIFGALWELAESSQVGMEIDLKSIPVKQETIEICEFFRINPYILNSGGSMLIAAANGHHLVQVLGQNGISACVIGRTTAQKERIIRNGEDCRYIERPKPDELYRII
jgi:hydrogenase expression/formation protein HypE